MKTTGPRFGMASPRKSHGGDFFVKFMDYINKFCAQNIVEKPITQVNNRFNMFLTLF